MRQSNLRSEILEVTPSGTGTRPLVSGLNVQEAPDVSPDGRSVVFSGLGPADKVQHLYVVAGDSTTAHRITDSRFTDTAPHWSHDGRHIAFLRKVDIEDGQANDVFVADHDGAHAIDVTRSGGGEEREVSWAPDDSGVVYTVLTFNDVNIEELTGKDL